jgi:hypothetical protein
MGSGRTPHELAHSGAFRHNTLPTAPCQSNWHTWYAWPRHGLSPVVYGSSSPRGASGGRLQVRARSLSGHASDGQRLCNLRSAVGGSCLKLSRRT